jgi:Tfp pilus assembly protein PilO
VTLHNVNISRVGNQLAMDLTAKTYRYLESEERTEEAAQ